MFDSSDGLRLSNSTTYQGNSVRGGSGTLPRRHTDAVSLNAAAGSAAYYKALNLQSKQRRPRGSQLPMTPGVRGNSASGIAYHPVGKPYLANGFCPNGNVVKAEQPRLLEQISLSSPQAQERLDALRKQCASLPWPDGQPQKSQVCRSQVNNALSLPMILVLLSQKPFAEIMSSCVTPNAA